MNNFRKNTIALIMIVAFTIAGCFATETYKNSIMAIDLEAGTNGAVTMVIQTKKPYSNNINLVKKDAVTYVMLLPEFDSSASTPNLTKVGNISSINVQTRPYTSDNNGYTKITIKTNGNASIFPQYKIYMPETLSSSLPDNAISNRNTVNNMRTNISERRNTNRELADTTIKETKTTVSSQQAEKDKNFQTTPSSANIKVAETEQNNEKPAETEAHASADTQSTVQLPGNDVDNSVSIWSVILLLCSVIGAIILLIMGKNKMAEVIGSNMDITIDDNENDTGKIKNIKQVKHPSVTTHKSMLKQTLKPLRKQNLNPVKNNISIKENNREQVVVEKINAIDMDELFNLQKENVFKQPEQDVKNEALEDFLNNYYDEMQKNPEINEELIDETTYNHVLQNNKLKFSPKDITKINSLMGTEITEDVKQLLSKKNSTNPIPESRQIYSFENIIADYCIKQNIIFSSEDIKIIHKLMSVELDQDFITDLRTKRNKDTSVSTVTKNEKKEDDSTETKNNTEKSSVVQVGEYNVSVLKIEAELPDLQDVLAHPEKYEDSEPDDVAVDENVLLQSLSNVQFKPFYSEDNPITDSDLVENSYNNHSPQEDVPKTPAPISNEFSKTNEVKHKTLIQHYSNSILVDGIYYDILSVAYFNKNAGVYLTKADNLYVVYGFIGEEIHKLKAYNSLKSEKIIIRISETFDNGTIRYLVKMGLKKFVLDYNENKITYVMDLC